MYHMCLLGVVDCDSVGVLALERGWVRVSRERVVVVTSAFVVTVLLMMVLLLLLCHVYSVSPEILLIVE